MTLPDDLGFSPIQAFIDGANEYAYQEDLQWFLDETYDEESLDTELARLEKSDHIHRARLTADPKMVAHIAEIRGSR